jgi:AraC family transcriptional regulator
MDLRLAHGHYFGESLRRGSVGALTLIESQYAAGLVASRHTHERSCFCIVLDGGFSETYGRKQRRCSAGSVIFRPAGEDHANDFERGARCLNIELSDAWMARLAEHAAAPSWSLDVTHTPVSKLAASLYHEFRIGDDLAPLAMEGIAIETLATLSRLLRTRERAPRAPAWLSRVRERLHAEPPPSSLAELAATAGVHPVHLARAFRRHHGCTVGAYLRRRRVDRACRLLEASSLSLSQIALEAGFSHHSHFANAFKRATGLTPAAYRRRAGIERPRRRGGP